MMSSDSKLLPEGSWPNHLSELNVEGLLSNHLVRQNREFQTYVNEAKFALKALMPELIKLEPGAKILEIGSGIGLLSAHLARAGFSVVALEPNGSGFEHMEEMQNIVLNQLEYMNLHNLQLSSTKLEEMKTELEFDFIFSVNVLEHVEDPKLFLQSSINLLSGLGSIRIICPNYGFPYEGHFNIPIILNKKLTEIIFRQRIRNFSCPNPLGLWSSLNWISQRKLRLILEQHQMKCTFRFSNLASLMYLNRAGSDSIFKDRKGKLLIAAALVLGKFLKYLPIRYQTNIDLLITK
jgi:2-polyprenyl-3-methyl-5-hydroxy-6-metoxy-1,4-benzoquinol methylase